MAESPLVLGPMLRHVDETSASIWVETRDAGTVEVRALAVGPARARSGCTTITTRSSRSTGSSPTRRCRTRSPSTVWWRPDADPRPDVRYPASVIATRVPGRRLRMAYGSCRTSAPYDGTATARTAWTRCARSPSRWRRAARSAPTCCCSSATRCYADLTSKQMQDFIRSRRDIREEPGKELKDYEEYAHLYQLAWSDAANRWLLSTVPTAMIFDDHDVRDDWNASLDWKKEMGRRRGGTGASWPASARTGVPAPRQPVAARAGRGRAVQRIVAHDGEGEPRPHRGARRVRRSQ